MCKLINVTNIIKMWYQNKMVTLHMFYTLCTTNLWN